MTKKGEVKQERKKKERRKTGTKRKEGRKKRKEGRKINSERFNILTVTKLLNADTDSNSYH